MRHEKFAHKVKCPNYIKKQSNNYYTTLNNDDSAMEDEQEGQFINFVAFIGHIEPTVNEYLDDNSEDEEDMTEEELLEDYKILYTK
ncbi:hypothetical protein LIER_18748 [Lithospermum erythrorhizon]|uniref:Uncharacterized protein n=1 Tax=Lithospermum erythrorhizon TaxID=34254 RepID=A0AAV3QKI5_LITER